MVTFQIAVWLFLWLTFKFADLDEKAYTLLYPLKKKKKRDQVSRKMGKQYVQAISQKKYKWTINM